LDAAAVLVSGSMPHAKASLSAGRPKPVFLHFPAAIFRPPSSGRHLPAAIEPPSGRCTIDEHTGKLRRGGAFGSDYPHPGDPAQ